MSRGKLFAAVALISLLGLVALGVWAMQEQPPANEDIAGCDVIPLAEDRSFSIGEARITIPDDPTLLLRPTEAAASPSSCSVDE